MSKKSIVIVGGGLTGALAALALSRDGHKVSVYERRGDIRDARIVHGRSINLAISTRGLTALERVGLREHALEMAVPMRGRRMHGKDSTTTFQPYSPNADDNIYSISRGGLNKFLIEKAAEEKEVELHFQQRCIGVDARAGVVRFEHEDTGEIVEVNGDLVIGADGAYSAVRQNLMVGDRFNYSQDYLTHGYTELYIPPAEDGEFRIEKNALHIWPRGKFMMIALPNGDGSFTGTLFWPLEGESSFSQLKDPSQVKRYFEEWFPDVPALVPDLEEQYLASSPSSLVTIRCKPWVVGKIALVGDSAHAIVPFYGQGMNAGFEDVRILCERIESNPKDLDQALVEYQEERIVNGNAIADLALQNFYEMQDHVAKPLFLLSKKFSNLLQKCLPGWYRSLYSMVSFSNTPYADAISISKSQEKTIRFVVVLVVAIVVMAFLWSLK
mgnify:FL=1